jgi:hypothetical protein
MIGLTAGGVVHHCIVRRRGEVELLRTRVEIPSSARST